MNSLVKHIFIVLILLWSTSALAKTDITIKSPFARASIPGTSVGVVFMHISNRGVKERLLIEARSNIARHVEIHSHIEINGVMHMRQIPHIHIKPGETAVLGPGGLHIMLIELYQSLKDGESLQLTLIFNDGHSQTVTVPVKSISATE